MAVILTASAVGVASTHRLGQFGNLPDGIVLVIELRKRIPRATQILDLGQAAVARVGRVSVLGRRPGRRVAVLDYFPSVKASRMALRAD